MLAEEIHLTSLGSDIGGKDLKKNSFIYPSELSGQLSVFNVCAVEDLDMAKYLTDQYFRISNESCGEVEKRIVYRSTEAPKQF